MRTFRFAALSLAMVLASFPALAADPAAARDHLKKGYELAQENKCDEAIPHLAESLRLDPKAITLINLAQCEEKVGKLSDALGHWVDARARAQSENNADIQIEAEKRAKALEARLPHLTIVLAKNAPPGTEVSRDGVVLGSISLGQSASVSPGKHEIVVKAPGRKDARTEISLAEAETKTVNVDVGEVDPNATTKPPPTAETKDGNAGGTSPLVYVGFGTAIVGLTVGTITGLVALGAASKAKDNCPNTACPTQDKLDDVDSGRTMGTISTIGFAVMGAGIAVGVVGLLSSGKTSGTSAPAKTGRVVFGPGGVGGSF